MRPQRRLSLLRSATLCAALVTALLPVAARAALVARGAPVAIGGPQVAMAARGDLEVVWQSASTLGVDLLTQHLDASGVPTAPPVAIATATSLSNFVPTVAALPSGGFVVAWELQPVFLPWLLSAPAAGGLSARLLDTGGQPLGAAFALDSGRAFGLRITPLATQGFAALWTGESAGLVARRFDDTGQALGAEVRLAPAYGAPGFAILGLVDGGWLAVWFRQPGADLTVQRFDAADAAVGTPGTLLAPALAQVYALAADRAGRLVVGWMIGPFGAGARALTQSFDLAGNPLSPLLTVAAADASGNPLLRGLAVDTGGRFVALWDRSPFAGLSSVNAQIYDPSGLALGSATVVNPLTGDDHGADVLVGNDGTWRVVWKGNNGASYGTFLQRLDSAFCTPPGGLCLGGDRFTASVAFRDPASGATGSGHPVPLADDSGALWFFDPQNPELIVKLIDGTAVNGRHWLFYASLTDVEFDLTVRDDRSGEQRLYHNPAGTLASVADTEAFGSPAPTARTAPVAAAGSASPRLATTAPRDTAPAVCHFEPQALCLEGSFRLAVTWRDPRSGRTGTGQATQRSAEGGDFWFFARDEVDLAVKVLDGRAVNGHFWVFYASLTDVEFDLTVVDGSSPAGASRVYHNPPYHLASAADTQAF